VFDANFRLPEQAFSGAYLMNKLIVRLFAVAAIGALAAACAQPARTNAMVVNVSEATILQPDSPLKNNIAVANVSGGEETNPLWTSEVDNKNFQEALILSLQQHTMHASKVGGMQLVVTMQKLDQPLVGFDLEVTSTVRYLLTHPQNGVVYDETITYAHTQDFSTAALAVKRLQLANEGAIRNNIAAFIKNVITASQAKPDGFGSAPATS
jgi:hypothetical protein